jgi:hypothetical protein
VPSLLVIDRIRMRRFVLVLGTVVAVTACGDSNNAQQGDSAVAGLPPGHVPIAPSAPTDLAPLTQALLDSGNTAFRLQQFDQALAFYAKASVAQPEHAAPWFGTYMVGQATKNVALSDSALRMVRERAPGMQEHPGAALPGDAPPSGAAQPPATPYSPHGSPTPASQPRSRGT